MEESKQYEINIIIGDSVVPAILYANPTTDDFFSLLPLELKLDDYASTEKLCYLPRKLSTKDAPSGYNPSIGDITYYAPWGNLALFYKDFGYAEGLIHLGKVESGMDMFKTSSSLHVRIEFRK
ncbi:MAG: cyclophilin [Deferribacteres bacterium]|nr:cyclophilin [candidate division KSB1 bacterium]MCB9504081.1 cyclophilin [Deferribacteres bacterium]